MMGVTGGNVHTIPALACILLQLQRNRGNRRRGSVVSNGDVEVLQKTNKMYGTNLYQDTRSTSIELK